MSSCSFSGEFHRLWYAGNVGRAVSVVIIALAAACGGTPSGPVVGASTGGTPEEKVQPPAEVYSAFVRALPNAGTIEDLAPFLALQVRSNLLQLGAEARKKKLAEAKRNAPQDVKVLGETTVEDKTTLKLECTRAGKRVQGRAVLVRELGLWKVQNEVWDE